MINQNATLVSSRMVVCLAAVAVAAVAARGNGLTNRVEDFEGYTVTAGAFLDPASVGGSGWTSNGVDTADWEVTCCATTFPYDDPFDGSDKALLLRRSNATLPGETDENYDFALLPFSNGTVSVEVNPGSTGNSNGGFGMELRDGVRGSRLVSLQHTEQGGWVPSVGTIGDWRVFSSLGAILAEGGLGGQPGVPDAFPHAWDRWFRVTVTLNGPAFDVLIEDIGPTSNAGTGPGRDDPARGNVITLTNIVHGGAIDAIDQLRLVGGGGVRTVNDPPDAQGNGGNNTTDPTMIDNIIQNISEAPGGTPVGVELVTAVEILYATQAGKLYQPQYTDDLPSDIWTDIGPLLGGDGDTNSFLESTIGLTNRNYRVLEF